MKEDNPMMSEVSASEKPAITIEDSQLEPTKKDKQSLKGLAYAIGILVLIFGIGFGSLHFLGSSSDTALATGLTIQDLHDQNLQGRLSEDQGYVFKGFSFVRDENLWYWEYANEGGSVFELLQHYDPKEIRDLPVTGRLNTLHQSSPAYHIAIDPLNTDQFVAVAAGEITKILAKVEFRRVLPSCTVNETDACATRPIISCDENQTTPVIEVRNEGEASITIHNRCIIVQGTDNELIAAADRFIYEWLGVL